MSIDLGIYDFFAYTLPGLLYLFAFNEFSKSINWKNVDFNSLVISGQELNIINIMVIFVGGYLVGHLMDTVSNKFFDLFSTRKTRSNRKNWYMRSIKDRYPSLGVQFEPKDRTLLFALIRQRNIEMARILDNFSANNIMLRNVALGLFLLGIVQIIFFFRNGVLESLFLSIVFFLLFFLSKTRSDQYRGWFIKDVLRASLEYGTSVDEVVEFSRKKVSTKNKMVPESKNENLVKTNNIE